MNKDFLNCQEHIKDICNDVTDLIENKHVFYRLRELLRPNIGITDNVFFDHYVVNYVSTMVSGVRRQADKNTSLGGLRKLLEKIETNPEIITKEDYLIPYRASVVPGMDKVGEKSWKEKYGGADTIDVDIVRDDLVLLESVTSKVKDFVDKRVAHKDKEWKDYELTYGELDKAVDTLEKLTIKYYELLTGSGIEKLLPSFHYDWENIFRDPWVK